MGQDNITSAITSKPPKATLLAVRKVSPLPPLSLDALNTQISTMSLSTPAPQFKSPGAVTPEAKEMQRNNKSPRTTPQYSSLQALTPNIAYPQTIASSGLSPMTLRLDNTPPKAASPLTSPVLMHHISDSAPTCNPKKQAATPTTIPPPYVPSAQATKSPASPTHRLRDRSTNTTPMSTTAAYTQSERQPVTKPASTSPTRTTAAQSEAQQTPQAQPIWCNEEMIADMRVLLLKNSVLGDAGPVSKQRAELHKTRERHTPAPTKTMLDVFFRPNASTKQADAPTANANSATILMGKRVKRLLVSNPPATKCTRQQIHCKCEDCAFKGIGASMQEETQTNSPM